MPLLTECIHWLNIIAHACISGTIIPSFCLAPVFAVGYKYRKHDAGNWANVQAFVCYNGYNEGSGVCLPCMCLYSVEVNIYEWKCLNAQLGMLSCIVAVYYYCNSKYWQSVCTRRICSRMQHCLELEFSSVWEECLLPGNMKWVNQATHLLISNSRHLHPRALCSQKIHSSYVLHVML